MPGRTARPSRPSGRCRPPAASIPARRETLQLLPEEERHEEYIEVYTSFPLSAGENDGGAEYAAPDRIIWNGYTWRVIRVRDWSGFGYYQVMAVKMHE